MLQERPTELDMFMAYQVQCLTSPRTLLTHFKFCRLKACDCENFRLLKCMHICLLCL